MLNALPRLFWVRSSFKISLESFCGMKNSSSIADQVHRKFSSMPDAKHIATLVNIRRIVDLCMIQKPDRVLELGGGIGAISYAILACSDAFLDIYEDNLFCQDRLRENLKDFEGRYSIIPTYRMLPPEREYDLMIIDGGQKELYHPEWFYVRYLDNLRSIYIEGKRRSQYAWVSKGLFPHYAFVVEKIPDQIIGGSFYKGGTLIQCRKSANILGSFARYLYYRIREDFLLDRLIKFLKRKIIRSV